MRNPFLILWTLLLIGLVCLSVAVEIREESDDTSAVLVPLEGYRDQNLVLACLLDGSVVALDAKDGEQRWRIDGTQNFFTPLDQLQVLNYFIFRKFYKVITLYFRRKF